MTINNIRFKLFIQIQNKQTKQIFESIFTHPKPNLIQFDLFDVTFSLDSWKMFTALKWLNLQTLSLRKKYVT